MLIDNIILRCRHSPPSNMVRITRISTTRQYARVSHFEHLNVTQT